MENVRIKKILVSQPAPESGKSPYFDLAEKTGVHIDFKPFIQVTGVSTKDFRAQKVNILDHSAVIFTSKTAIDHFFRLSTDMRLVIPEGMKYFCISESTALYLQKYTVYRKRKIFYGTGKLDNLIEIMLKHKCENYLVPLSDVHNEEITSLFVSNGFKHSVAIMYQTISNDMSDIAKFDYDILVFFSPSGIASLGKNFPNFTQDKTIIAAFGPTTAEAVRQAGLRLDIMAPTPAAPSMTMALDKFITEYNKKSK